MDFTLGTREEALEAAEQAERVGGNFVSEPGGYDTIIESAVFKSFPSGAGGMELVGKTEDGVLCKVFLLTQKKDGTSTYGDKKLPLPGINQIRGALMPVIRQNDLKGVVNGKEIIYPQIVGKKVGMLVNIKKSLGKTNGKLDKSKVYSNADIKTFYCPATGLCGSEILGKVKTPERKAKILESLKIIDETNIGKEEEKVDYSDPFAESDDNSTDDAFSDNSTDSSKVEEKVEEKVEVDTKEEVVEETEATEVSSTDAEENFWN